jgi:LacI family transcriptional regulator
LLDEIIDELVIQHRADAIIVHNDFIASALIKRLRQRSIRVPEQLGIVGYLNHYLCDYIDPPLTSLDLNHHLVAKEMVTAIQEMVEHGSCIGQRREITVPPRVISRNSA